jgi:hypothetical protein
MLQYQLFKGVHIKLKMGGPTNLLLSCVGVKIFFRDEMLIFCVLGGHAKFQNLLEENKFFWHQWGFLFPYLSMTVTSLGPPLIVTGEKCLAHMSATFFEPFPIKNLVISGNYEKGGHCVLPALPKGSVCTPLGPNASFYLLIHLHLCTNDTQTNPHLPNLFTILLVQPSMSPTDCCTEMYGIKHIGTPQNITNK